MYKIFKVYWLLGEKNAVIPSEWPKEYATTFGYKHPMEVNFNGNPSETYIAVSYFILLPLMFFFFDNLLFCCRVLLHNSAQVVEQQI